jgi:hypothetical protein
MNRRRRIPTPEDWVCSICGNDNVHTLAWVNPNTEEIANPFVEAPSGDFCPGCQSSTVLILRREYEKLNQISGDPTPSGERGAPKP